MSRWTEVLNHLSTALGDATVVVDGTDPAAVRDVAGRIPQGNGDRIVSVWVRTERKPHPDADIVIDLETRDWPVLKHIDAGLSDERSWYLTESRAFFGIRAETWDAKFGDDMPAYAAAVRDADFATGGTIVDVGCGTGRALPALSSTSGSVIGVDHTPQMLAVARKHGQPLILADAMRLPFGDGTVDGVFAAGLVMHLPDPAAGLRELARITRRNGRLALFHPTGRSALAERHGRLIRPDDPLNEEPLRSLLDRTGWHLRDYDDPAHRFLAVADRG